MTDRFTVAFDFDGTVTEHDEWYPKPGPEVPEAIRVLQRFSNDERIALVLLTCRENVILDEALEFLEVRHIFVDGINESAPEMPVRTRKPYYEILVCDRNFPVQPVDWKAVEEYVYKQLENGWERRAFPFYEVEENRAISGFYPYKKIEKLKTSYHALDKNWATLHEASMKGIREALGLPADTITPLILHEIKKLKRQASKVN